eukprot:SAG31_NODE_1941_length_6859_cov_3.362278_6_plen_96_part_00
MLFVVVVVAVGGGAAAGAGAVVGGDVIAWHEAIRAGIIPSTVQIRLAAHDVEGDRCIIASDMEMQVQLTRQRVDGTVRLFVWISPAADGELKKAV